MLFIYGYYYIPLASSVKSEIILIKINFKLDEKNLPAKLLFKTYAHRRFSSFIYICVSIYINPDITAFPGAEE